jgi:hypothetical protein
MPGRQLKGTAALDVLLWMCKLLLVLWVHAHMFVIVRCNAALLCCWPASQCKSGVLLLLLLLLD